MEERGRGRFVPKRRRLLTAIAVASLASHIPLFAVDVSVFVSSFELEPGQPLVIELSVPDANPADVTLSDFTVPPTFAATTGRKELRYAGADPVTVVSREWIPSESGVFTIGPFQLVVRGERVSVAPVRITVIKPQGEAFASLAWKVVPDDQAVTGKALTISLEAVFSGTVGILSCPAPENAILELVSNPVPAGTRLSATAREPVVIAVWKWTPLETGWQAFPAATLRIVEPNGVERVLASAPSGRTVARGAAVDTRARIPGSVARLFSGVKPIDDASRTPPDTTSSSGDADDGNVEMLARLRRAEYTSFFPSSARNERIALEDSLGLSPSLPVPPAAWKPVALVGSVVFFTLAFALRLVGRPLRRKGLLFRPATFLLFILSLLLAIFSITLYTRDRIASGVCRGGDLYHVPEAGSSVIARLPEGFAAHIGRRADGWAYVTASDGMAGWVRSEAIIEYTTGN